MATISDSLPSDVAAYIQAAVQTGKYQSPEEVLSAAVRELRDRERSISELNSQLDEGLRDIEQGNVISILNENEHSDYFESIKHRGRAQLNERRRSEGKPPLSNDTESGHGPR